MDTVEADMSMSMSFSDSDNTRGDEDMSRSSIAENTGSRDEEDCDEEK
jgi:hypothetical protein